MSAIPQKLQETVLQGLHKNHPGIVHMKAISRSYICWEGVDRSRDIELLVNHVRHVNQLRMHHPWLHFTHDCGQANLGNICMWIFLAPFQGRT